MAESETAEGRSPEIILDDMMAAQTRFAQVWRDGLPLTLQQQRFA